MTEEKIIDDLKQIKEMFDNMKIHDNLYINRPDIYAGVINSMLDLYNKQKEEIKALELIHETYKEEMKSIEDRYISKDKIIDKIHEIGSETQYLLTDKGETKQNYAIRKLKELLEEGDPDAK